MVAEGLLKYFGRNQRAKAFSVLQLKELRLSMWKYYVRSYFIAINFEKLKNGLEVTWTFWQEGSSVILYIFSEGQVRAKGQGKIDSEDK